MQGKPNVVGRCTAAVLAASLAASLALVLAGPAQAQHKAAKPDMSNSPAAIQKKKEAAAIDLEYRKALQAAKTEAAPAKLDPWQNIRGPQDGKTKP
jgi:hypothetical protein